MGHNLKIQTSALPVQVKDQTHYLTRTDGERTLHNVVLDGVYATQQNLQAMVHLFDDRPGNVYLGARTGALSLYASLSPDEAALVGQALINAADEARKRLDNAAQNSLFDVRAA